MAANTSITEETRRKLEALAGPGKADELAEQVLSAYLIRQEAGGDLADLATWGKMHAKRRGFKASDVAQAIAETCAERNSR